MIHENTPLDALIGKVIQAIYVSDDILVVRTDAGDLAFDVQGDCCSQSWYSDIFGADTVLGKMVTGIEEGSAPDTDDDRGRDEVDQGYSYIIATENGGKLDVQFRNSSNGYYGGWMDQAIKLTKFDPESPVYHRYEQVHSTWRNTAQ